MNTARAIISSAASMPVAAIAAAAATVTIRFFGLTLESSTPNPSAFGGVKESIVVIHFGSVASSSPRGRPRHCLSASRISSRPSTRRRTLTQVAGSLSSLALMAPETSSTTVPTSVRPPSHPIRNASPLARARGVASINTTAMIGTGLSPTTTPSGRIAPMASFMAPIIRMRWVGTHHPARMRHLHPTRRGVQVGRFVQSG
jgi:hypothetical protein